MDSKMISKIKVAENFSFEDQKMLLLKMKLQKTKLVGWEVILNFDISETEKISIRISLISQKN
jgi:hypothetical protein